MSRRKLIRWSVRLAAGSLVLVGLIGLAHTSAGRPLLAALGWLPGCPVSLDNADPARVEEFRVAQLQNQLQNHGAAPPAGALVAGEFRLGSSRELVRRWLEDHAAECAERRSGSVLACKRAGSGARELRDLHLQFDGRQRLVAVDFYRPASCAEQVLRELDGTTSRLEREVGPVTHRQGRATPAFLSGGSYRRVAREFEYADYSARLSAMADQHGEVRMRESYQWLPADPS